MIFWLFRYCAWSVFGLYWLGKEGGSRVARMPNHAMRLHEWGTQSVGGIVCVYGTPATQSSGVI